MNVAEFIVRYLESIDVSKIFYIPGGPLNPITEAVWNSSQIDFVYTSHEGGAAFLAHGYACQSGSLGVCCVTTGPGATNAITGVATAKLDHVPMLVLTAMNPIKNFSRKSSQDSTRSEGIDTVGLYEKFTHYSTMIHSAHEIPYIIRNAIKIAMLKQGPVHISVPMDIGYEKVPEDYHILPQEKYLPTATQRADEKEIQKAADWLTRAERPVLFAGYGSIVSGASEQIRTLAERLSIPVITTMKAKGVFPENHALSLGVFGLAGSNHAMEYFENPYDVLFTIGAGLHEASTDNFSKKLTPTGAHIQLDPNPLNYGHYYSGDVGLIGDAKSTLERLLEVLDERTISFSQVNQRLEETNLFKRTHLRFDEPEKMLSNSSPIKPQRLMHDLENSFPEDTVYVVDIGGSFLWATHFLTLKKPKTYVASTRNAPMGFSVAAIGCKCASPDTPVVAIIGDGAFKMHGMEVAAAVNNNLPVIFVVLNDSMWGLVDFGNQAVGLDVDVARYQRVDCVKIAEALGARGIRITEPGEINPEFVQSLCESGETIVLDVQIDATECPPFGSRIKELRQQMLGKKKENALSLDLDIVEKNLGKGDVEKEVSPQTED